MAICKFCGDVFQWGQDQEGRFVPLIPSGEEGEHPRTHQDANGELRATHFAACTHRAGPLISVTKLAHPVHSSMVLEAPRKKKHGRSR